MASASAEEREWFRLLQTVQNVGAQGGAVGALDACRRAICSGRWRCRDKAMIGRAPGVGPKLALRIATELKDKAPAMMLRGDDDAVAPVAAPRGPAADAVSALVKLGYSEGQAAEAVARAARDLGDARRRRCADPRSAEGHGTLDGQGSAARTTVS